MKLCFLEDKRSHVLLPTFSPARGKKTWSGTIVLFIDISYRVRQLFIKERFKKVANGHAHSIQFLECAEGSNFRYIFSSNGLLDGLSAFMYYIHALLRDL